MARPLARRLFARAAAASAGPPLVALPFWLADAAVGEWAGSLAFYEVVAAPVALALVTVAFYRKTRWFEGRTYASVLAAAAALGVGLWYVGLGLHAGTLLRPSATTVELMAIALGTQTVGAAGAVVAIAGVRRMRAAEAEEAEDNGEDGG